MRLSSRALTGVASALVPLLLVTACGSVGGPSASNLTPISGSSYVTIEPATTTTTTTTTTIPGLVTEVIDPNATTTAPIGVGCTHTIVAGENPTMVAGFYDLSFAELQSANPSIDFTRTFIVGDSINIPSNGNCGGAAAAAVAAAGCTHTIAAGENPTQVASSYDLSFNQLQAANPNIDFTTTFVVGDVIVIPSAEPCD